LSEKLFKFLLSELSIIRVECQKCKGVAEVALSGLTKAIKEEANQNCLCPFCGHDFYRVDLKCGPLHELVHAINTLAGYTGQVQIQFVLKDQANPAGNFSQSL